MKQKTPAKDNTFIYIISTLSFIFLGIILTSVIDQTKSKDVRTRASATNGIDAVAIVSSVDQETNTIQVSNLTFASSTEKNLGAWTITPPPGFALASLIPSNTIQLVIDPATFSIESHTLTAKKLQKK